MRLYCILFCFYACICPHLQFYLENSGPRELSADAEVAQIIALSVLLIKGCASEVVVQQLICLQAELSLDILLCCRFIFAVQLYGIYTKGFQFLSQLGMHQLLIIVVLEDTFCREVQVGSEECCQSLRCPRLLSAADEGGRRKAVPVPRQCLKNC